MSTTISSTSWQVLHDLASGSGKSISQTLDDIIAIVAAGQPSFALPEPEQDPG